MKHNAPREFSGALSVNHIALIGNSMPRRCGIATFTTHCRDALKSAFPHMRVDSYAMDDGADPITYSSDVYVISQDDRAAYAEAAARIEDSGAEAIWLQHEFGIFGGAAGDMILHLLDRTSLPLVVTLHTISASPSADERRVMERLVHRAGRLMVMAGPGRQLLVELYGVDEAIIVLVPHGVPDRPLVAPALKKPVFGWDGHRVILTFGLLAPDKGIDQMIHALPAIVAEHPDALYVVLGATHPNLIRAQGENLRAGLMALGETLGVARNIRFIDAYVEQEELLDYLQAADIYVTPYVNPAQVVSGTLSYAIGMGKPVVSTPYVQAREILDEERGVLVPFRDPAALACEINRLLSDDASLQAYSLRAYACGRGMIWSELARHVGVLLREAVAAVPVRFSPRRTYALLRPDPSSVIRMSDETGMLQHSVLTIPDRHHGYCVDDNARALILMTQIQTMDSVERDHWMTVYASFLQHAWNDDRGRFRNFMAYDRRWCEEEGSEDSCGRTLWALGVTMRDAPTAVHRDWAGRLFETALGPLASLGSPRARAFMILGIGAVLDMHPTHPRCRALIAQLADALQALLRSSRSPDWHWFEGVLAYDNARLPEALLVAGRHLNRVDLVQSGLESLAWIADRQTSPEGHFRAVGSESFGRERKPPLPYDQQPLEAQAMIDAAISAWMIEADTQWTALAERAYRWFLGQNDLDTPLATPGNSGCFDGLTPHGPNLNQGAESLLALQLASCAMNRLSLTLSEVAESRFEETPIVSA